MHESVRSGPPHPSAGLAVALLILGGFLCVLGFGASAQAHLGWGVLGALMLLTALWLWRSGDAVHLVNSARALASSGRAPEAAVLLDRAAARHGWLVSRNVELQRALIHWAVPDIERTVIHATRAIEGRGARWNARSWLDAAFGLRALAAAVQGNRDAAVRDVQQVIDRKPARPEPLAYAELARAVVLYKEGAKGELRQHLSKNCWLLFEHLPARERVLTHALWRAAYGATPQPSADDGRAPGIHEADSSICEPELSSSVGTDRLCPQGVSSATNAPAWARRVAPSLSAFVLQSEARPVGDVPSEARVGVGVPSEARPGGGPPRVVDPAPSEAQPAGGVPSEARAHGAVQTESRLGDDAAPAPSKPLRAKAGARRRSSEAASSASREPTGVASNAIPAEDKTADESARGGTNTTSKEHHHRTRTPAFWRAIAAVGGFGMLFIVSLSVIRRPDAGRPEQAPSQDAPSHVRAESDSAGPAEAVSAPTSQSQSTKYLYALGAAAAVVLTGWLTVARRRQTRLTLGRLQLAHGDLDGAEQTIVPLCSTGNPLLRAVAMLELARVSDRRGNFALSLSLCDKALAVLARARLGANDRLTADIQAIRAHARVILDDPQQTSGVDKLPASALTRSSPGGRDTILRARILTFARRGDWAGANTAALAQDPSERADPRTFLMADAVAALACGDREQVSELHSAVTDWDMGAHWLKCAAPSLHDALASFARRRR